MKILNLTNNETSDIKFEVSKFPDGQQQVKIINYNDLFSDVEYEFAEPHLRTDVQIKARLNNFKDLELIICATKSLRNLGIENLNLYVPYFLGSRSDRKFEEGSNNYLKDVICPIINSLGFESVTVLDPHSDVLEACLNNFKKVDNKQLIISAINNFYNIKTGWNESKPLKNFILISPDAGTNKKIFKVAEQIGYTGDIITCSKSRDVNGELTKTVVPININEDKDYIIIDDICDGGRTFINIAEKIHNKYYEYSIACEKEFKPKIYLIVTHGIFSKGFKELNKYFDGIYCTNSYKDIADIENDEKTNVKQLNLF